MAKRRLTQKQRERIKAIQQKRRERVECRVNNAISDNLDNNPREGLVITRHGQNLAVQDQQGILIHCLSRQNIGQVVCGDQVVWQPTTPGEGVVTAIMERQSALIRPNYSGENRALAANISQIVIVLAPEPPPSPYLVDQYLVTAENIGVKTLIALNKKDLMDAKASASFDKRFEHYQAIGYPIVKISAKYEDGLAPLLQHLQEQTSILVGQSGVGKSSLVNALLPNLEVQVGQLSEASGLGKHTTSTTILYQMPSGGRLIDSPGVRSFRLGQLTPAQLETGFTEFSPFLGACRFTNCNHTNEPGCRLNQAAAEGDIHPDRLANFLHMMKNLPTDY